jgi:hypothetical protein
MTLELNRIAQQVKLMGINLAQQQSYRADLMQQARELLHGYATRREELMERIQLAERVQHQLRFDWVGAAPTSEPINSAFPLPDFPPQTTVVASDGSQIYPDHHALTLYYLINTGGIVYRHGSSQKPVTHNSSPTLYYTTDDLLDDQGRIISTGEVNVRRDLAEIELLARLTPTDGNEPVVALLDGQFTLRVIDLPFHQQQNAQNAYIAQLTLIREKNALVAGYIDSPRSTFVLALLHLASLEPHSITDETLRLSPFRHLTDAELFRFLQPGERSAVFVLRAKGQEKYNEAGHLVHFFYLNVSNNPQLPVLARVEVPAWVALHAPSLELLHAVIVQQARVTGSYPYVLARADELAVISGEEREAVELMLAVEMRRHGLSPRVSSKQLNKNAFRASKEGFQL